MALAISGLRPAGMDLAMNLLLLAGWLEFLLTALNLLPVSQLDGGHVSYALFGTRHRFVAWSTVVVVATTALYTLEPRPAHHARPRADDGRPDPPASQPPDADLGRADGSSAWRRWRCCCCSCTPDPFGAL